MLWYNYRCYGITIGVMVCYGITIGVMVCYGITIGVMVCYGITIGVIFLSSGGYYSFKFYHIYYILLYIIL